jgi:signal transduction histidine kinase
MAWSRICGWILPGATERDSRFQQELTGVVRSGALAVGACEMAVAALWASWTAAWWQAALLAAAGGGTLLLARAPGAHGRTVLLAGLGSWLGAAALVCRPGLPAAAGAAPILLVMAATVPMQPLHALAVGAGVAAVHAVASWGGPAAGHLFLAVLALAAAGASAVVCAQRRALYLTHRDALRITETLAGAQLRAQLSESAIAIGKLAAALTHEINTPLGTLKSSVDTLLVLAARQATLPSDKQQRVVETQAELRRSVQASAERIQNVVARLQRFIHLEEAELKISDLNELLRDVAVLFEEHIQGRVRLEFQLQPLPALTCRPQQLYAVFSSLLSNAINAVNGDGRIVISTRRHDSAVEVRIQDNGRGMSPDELENVFDPSFKVSGERVSSGNWSLFNTRQIVFEHGGDIQIESAPGKGTTVSVTLPC